MMPLQRWLFFAPLALLAAEIAAFVLVASAIGVGSALLLLLVTSVAGAILLRRTGRKQWIRVSEAMNRGGMAAIELKGADVAAWIAGILLVVPGFITSILGLLLLLPGVPEWAGSTFGRVVRTQRPHRQPSGVVDLERDEWHQIREEQIERPRSPDDNRHDRTS